VAIHNLGEVWQRASLIQRILLLGVVLGCVGGAVLLFNWARRPSMGLLYAGLPQEEAARIVEKVRDAGLPYELKQGGTAVYVPEDKVYSLRLTMASAGLPTGDMRGYEILDEDSFGASPFQERLRAVRVREGELARSIQTLDAVAGARVHIVQPESGLFRKAEKASATVVVRLKGGYSLTASNIAAVTHLVAGGVEGLQAHEVVLVDQHGHLLTSPSQDPVGGQTTNLLDQRRQEEQQLAQKAEQQLAMVLGPNRATVQVSVEMNMATTVSESKVVGPEKGLTVKETIKESKSTEPARDKAGASGTTSDSTTDSTYEVPVKKEQKTEPAGQIRSKSVSVVVDLTPPKTEGEGADTTSRKMLVVKDVEEIVKNALGLKVVGEGTGEAAGSDTLTVKEATFYRPPASAALGPEDQGLFSKDFLLEVAKRSSLGLLVLGALVALRMFRGKKKPALEGQGAPALAAAGAQAAGGMLPGGGNADLLKAQITRALQDNPEEVKRLFLSWIDSEKGEA
jgi:flagellar M-ring protein FliF